MTATPVTLTGDAAHRFVCEHDYLHDAEIISVSSDLNYGTLEVSLFRLTLCVGEMTNWRETDTDATLFFKGVTGLNVSGEFAEYSVFKFMLKPEDRVQLVSDVGGLLEASFVDFEINVAFRTEQNTYI